MKQVHPINYVVIGALTFITLVMLGQRSSARHEQREQEKFTTCVVNGGSWVEGPKRMQCVMGKA